MHSCLSSGNPFVGRRASQRSNSDHAKSLNNRAGNNPFISLFGGRTSFASPGDDSIANPFASSEGGSRANPFASPGSGSGVDPFASSSMVQERILDPQAVVKELILS